MITMLFGPTPLLTALQVLLLVSLLGPEEIYQRITQLILVVRGGQDTDRRLN